MKKALIFLMIIISTFLTACSNNIYIIGGIKEDVLVHTEYIDKGVKYPSGYTLVTSGKVNTSIIGTYPIKYYIYSKDGELKKEINRFVYVIDYIAPIFKEKTKEVYYMGIKYTINDFLEDYSDNYTNKNSIKVAPEHIYFKEDGVQVLELDLIDSSNNKTTIKTIANVVLDLEKLIDEIYKGNIFTVSKSILTDGRKLVTVRISDKKTFSFYDTGSIHYLEKVTTNLGNSPTIQISSHYKKFNNANVTYHINGNTSSTYSAGFANIDATLDNVFLGKFTSTINYLNLDSKIMLEELNNQVNTVLDNFKDYFNNTLNLNFM